MNAKVGSEINYTGASMNGPNIFYCTVQVLYHLNTVYKCLGI